MIVIRSLVPGGVAEQDGRLKPVDRLMSVNDTNLEHSSLSFAVETLKGTSKGEYKKLFAKNGNCILLIVFVSCLTIQVNPGLLVN